MKVHICILSQQSLQNILPLGTDEIDLLILATSKEMLEQKKADDMQRVLIDMGWAKNNTQNNPNEKNIPSARIKDIMVLEAMPSNNFAEICQWAEKQINIIHETAPNAHITLNATGGTKLMCLGLIKAFEQPQLKDKVEIIYCDTPNDTLETIYPAVFQSPLPPDLLSAEEILKAHGIRITEAASDRRNWEDSVLERAKLTQYLGMYMHKKLGSFIRELNWALAKEIGMTKLEHPQFPLAVKMGKGIGYEWKYVLQLMAEYKLIVLTAPLHPQQPASFMVPTVEALRYLHGIWLEEYLWICFQGIGVKDVGSSVKISSIHNEESFKDNELDLVASHHNKLIVVECKTVNPRKLSEQQQMNEVLDKLTGISNRSGGLLTESWFVMARWPNNPAQEDKFRLQAKERKVVLIEPRHLADLTERLKVWEKTSRFPLND